MVAFVSSYPVSVYMVIGWGSQPVASYDPEATPLGVGMDPMDDGGCMAAFVYSCQVSVYVVIGWGSQLFPGYNLGATPLGEGMDPCVMTVVWLHLSLHTQ